MTVWTSAAIRQLPELDRSHIVDVHNYYDGPLDGIVTGPDGQTARFRLADDSDLDDRTLAVYPLTSGDEAWQPSETDTPIAWIRG